jgi:Ni/Fe-hydrogenase 1 B-type cytochrome subunit
MSGTIAAANRSAHVIPASDLARVYVWEWPVRVTHWLIVLSIVVLAVTGIYIGRPFLVVPASATYPFVTGTVKVIHSYAAIVFTLSVLSRVAWMFLGNSYARWDNFLPVRRHRRKGLLSTLRFYLFLLRKPPGYVGHNPLAGLTYVLVFVLYFVMIATGFALYSVSARSSSPMHVFQFLIPFFGGAQMARFLHHVGMWLLLGFAVHHVYSSVLMSQVEANATVESIVSGYKFVPREDVTEPGVPAERDRRPRG